MSTHRDPAAHGLGAEHAVRHKKHPIRPCMLDVRLSNGRKRRAGWRGAPVHGRAATAGTTRQRGADEGARRVPERPGLCAPMGPLWVHGAAARV